MIIDDNNNMIKITCLSSTNGITLYEFFFMNFYQIGKTSGEKKQNGPRTRDDQTRTTCEAILCVHTHGPAVVAGCNSKNQG